jgi:hypothetical protein
MKYSFNDKNYFLPIVPLSNLNRIPFWNLFGLKKLSPSINIYISELNETTELNVIRFPF